MKASGQFRTFPFDDKPDFFSALASKTVQPNTRRHFKGLVFDSYTYLIKYLVLLPSMDSTIARLYYIDGLSQDQISKIFNISQAAVSRRLKYVLTRIKFLLKMPSLNPIQVRNELFEILPEEHFEFAYYFYWELAQNRVKFFIKTSQSGAANKFFKILTFLEDFVAENQEEKISNLSDKDMIEDLNRKRYLSLVYLDYFRFIHKKSSIMTFLCKKNDQKRVNSIKVGPSIFS